LSVAVIIPTYNSMSFFKETLESVLHQTHAVDEILINDDGSTDGTIEYALEFAQRQRKPSVRVFQRSGQGQGISRTYAAAQTNCEWIAFIDHDDIWEPSKIERQLAELDRTGADLCYTSIVTFQQVGSKIETRTPPAVPPVSRLQEALYHSTTFLPSAVMVRRKKFLELGGFATGYTIAEDWELWLRLFHGGLRFAACEEPLVRFRVHAKNQSRNALLSLSEAMEVYGRHVVPHLPPVTRHLTHRKTRSAHEYAAALAMRDNGDPRQIAMLLTSISTFPFQKPYRYKVLAHMLYTRLRSRRGPQALAETKLTASQTSPSRTVKDEPARRDSAA
jgi:glycosyltransferase involved in cell wall biosynthesis